MPNYTAQQAPQKVIAGSISPAVDEDEVLIVKGHIVLPNDYLDVNEAADNIFEILAKDKKMFVRADSIVEIKVGEGGVSEIADVSPDQFRSRLSMGKRPVYHYVKNKDNLDLRKKSCSRDTAKLLLETLSARSELPHIQLVSESPILAVIGGELKSLEKGYHNVLGGVYITGSGTIPDVPLDKAVASIKGLLTDFRFQSDGDYARAIASIITPAMRISGMISRAVPIDFAEADKSQAGKTFRQKTIRAVYGVKSYMVSQRSGGVGSLDESISAGLLSGRQFIVLENMRGNIDSKVLEGIITWAESVNIRVPHKGEVAVSAMHVTFMLTSNSLSTTPDLANRSSIVRIRKQDVGYEFKLYPEGDLLDHIESNQPYYMGCVASVLRHWHRKGKQMTGEARHEFREWARKLDWIVQNLFGCVPLMDDHQEAHARLSDPKLSWLRQVAIEVSNTGKMGTELPATALWELADTAEIEMPSSRKSYDEKQGAQAVGRICGSIFHDDKEFEDGGAMVVDVQVDHFKVTRITTEEPDEKYRMRPVRRYRFTAE